jgi:hypothetical protein
MFPIVLSWGGGRALTWSAFLDVGWLPLSRLCLSTVILRASDKESCSRTRDERIMFFNILFFIYVVHTSYYILLIMIVLPSRGEKKNFKTY